jgi:hypothetical protein
MSTNHHPVVPHAPVQLECGACYDTRVRCEVSDHPGWWVRVTCLACGHVGYRVLRATPARAESDGEASQ